MNAKDILLIVIGLVVGVFITLGVRSAIHDPYKPEHQDHQHGAEHAEPNAPTQTPATPQTPTPPKDPHAGHGEPSPTPQEPSTQPPTPSDHTNHAKHSDDSTKKPVNTICALCGGDVDSSSKTTIYKGHVIGFGCPPCVDTFAEDPERYLPYYLKNEVIPD